MSLCEPDGSFLLSTALGELLGVQLMRCHALRRDRSRIVRLSDRIRVPD